MKFSSRNFIGTTFTFSFVKCFHLILGHSIRVGDEVSFSP